MFPSLFGADSDHMRHCWLLSAGKKVSHSISASICSVTTQDCSASGLGPTEDTQAGLVRMHTSHLLVSSQSFTG